TDHVSRSCNYSTSPWLIDDGFIRNKTVRTCLTYRDGDVIVSLSWPFRSLWPEARKREGFRHRSDRSPRTLRDRCPAGRRPRGDGTGPQRPEGRAARGSRRQLTRRPPVRP